MSTQDQPPYAPQPYAQQPHAQQPYAQPPTSAATLQDEYGRAYAAPTGSPYPGPDPALYAAQGYAPSWAVVRPPLASWGQRVGAYLIDALIQGGPMLLVYIPMIPMAMADPSGDSSGPAILGLMGLMMLAYAWAIGWWVFDRVIRQGRTGQSVGKRVMGLRLLHEHTVMPVGPGLALGREFAHLLDAYSMYIGYLWPLWDAKRQTFADKVCTTVVVQA